MVVPDFWVTCAMGMLRQQLVFAVALERWLSIRARKNPATPQSSVTSKPTKSQIANMAAAPATSFALRRERMNHNKVTISAAKTEPSNPQAMNLSVFITALDRPSTDHLRYGD